VKLYSYWRSSCSWRVRIALAHKGIAYEYAPVHLLRGGGEQLEEGYREKSPMAQVPTLEFEEGGEKRRLTQSLAIIEYLEERFPEPRLLPADPFLRAKARQLAEIVNAGIQPFQNLSAGRYVKAELGGDERAFARHFISRGLTAFEAEAKALAGRFSIGDTPSIADLCLVPQLYGARRMGVALEGFPTLLRVEAACAALPAFLAAHPDAQVDAVKESA